MLNLSPDLLIARGYHRECYQHPEDNDRCVKVVVHGGTEETRREQAYYRLLEKRLSDWRGIARFHGNSDTNLGAGAVFDLIRDADGSVSRTISQYLENAETLELHLEDIIHALVDFKHYQLKNNIQTMSLKPWNFVYQVSHEGRGSVFLIDSLGNSDFIPVCTYNGSFGRRKIHRKWAKFITLVERHYPRRDDTILFSEQLKTALTTG
jgi:hypothetical protein